MAAPARGCASKKLMISSRYVGVGNRSALQNMTSPPELSRMPRLAAREK